MAQSSDFRLPYNNLIQYVPQNLRNPVITSLLDNLFNRFLTHDESIPLYGYVGRKPADPEDRTPRVPQANVERDINSIIPVFSFKVGTERAVFTVQDLVKKAEAIGISPNNWQWLYSQGNNYAPPIDLDKFTNFFNYYWVAKAVTTTPDMPWNLELLPEYYTIAAPLPNSLDKLNVVAATTESTVLTGTGFNKLSFQLDFTSPTEFTITPVGSLGNYTPLQTTYQLGTDPDVYIDYTVTGPRGSFKLLEFNVVRDEIFDQAGNSAGLASFATGDQFLIDVTFLTRNYTVSFTGTAGVKGKLTKVRSLNEYQRIDGVQLREGDRVLVKNANPSEAGIYVVSPGNWERSADFTETTAGAGARVFVKGGTANGGKLFQSYADANGFYWQVVPGVTESNTNPWQEGNYWVRSEELSVLGLTRADVIQAVRPIIEYAGDLQLNAFVNNGKPAEGGVAYRQVKTEFNQLPLFDLFRYDGTHSGLVSSVFYYEEDLTADLDLALQRRVLRSTNDSADFIFNHGLVDEAGQLLFIKRGGELKTIWHAGYLEPTIVDVTYAGTGNGTLEGLTALGLTQQQVWTLRAETPTTFRVTGSKLLNVSSDLANVGQLYNNGEFSVTIVAGSIPFQAGDTFLFRVGNLESARYVYRDEDDNIFDLHGGPAADVTGKGAWQVPRLFYNNPYNEIRSPLTEGVLYSHFRGILANQIEGRPADLAFGGSIKLWSEQQTLLAALLMQRDLTPISMIDLAQHQYEAALSALRDLYERNVVQFLATHGAITTSADVEELLEHLQAIRASDNDVRTVLYDSTSPLVGFPATLPQLGIAELVAPTIDFDAVLGRTLLTHHDGHKSLLVEDTLEFRQAIFGNLMEVERSDGALTPAVISAADPPAQPYQGQLWVKPDGALLSFNVASDNDTPLAPEEGALWYKRSSNELYRWDGTTWQRQVDVTTPWTPLDLAAILNSLVLHAELKLHAGINPNARKYNFDAVLTDPAFQAQLKRELFSFAAANSYDPLGSDYDPTDAFTWNYSLASTDSLPPLSTPTVPARWHDLLKAHQSTVTGVIPTPRPNLEPWKLLGFEGYATWWASLPPAKQAAYTPYLRLEDLDVTFTNGGLVKVASTVSGDTDLSGLQRIDGVDLLQGDLVLLQSEATLENNGIWVVSSSNWTRANVPLVQGLYVTAANGSLNKDSTWVLTAAAPLGSPVRFEQARTWSSQLWDDIKLARPGLRLSVDARNDALLPPYVSPTNGWSMNALMTSLPPGVSLGYEFGESSPVETVWKASLEYRYSLARALFRYDPLAFLGFCWGFNWVEVDGILYDGFDMNMPGHRRFRLHGEPIKPLTRATPAITGGGDPLTLTCTAYDNDRRQNFTATANGVVIGYVQEGVPTTIGGYSFTLEDGGQPFRIRDRLELTSTGATFIPASTYQFMGFGQAFTHALRETSIDTSSSYAVSAYREWDVNMGYRAGGLVATDDLQVSTDGELLSPAAFDLLFKKNQLSRNEWAQALRVSVVQLGAAVSQGTSYVPKVDASDWVFRVEGYNPRYLDIAYYELAGDAPLTFYALSKAHTDLPWLHPVTVTGVTFTALPLTITGLQNVVNFLFGYAHYLEARGWEFNQHSEYNIDAETGRTRNYQLEIEKLIDACYAGINVGQGQIINPFIDRAWFNQETGLLAKFTDTALFDVTGHPGVFDALGVKYKTEDLDVARTNAQSSFGASGPMFSAHVQVDEFEHVFIFNNYSQPSTNSGLLYDPFSGGRIVTYKFNGRRQAAKTMRPEFGGHFLVGNEVHQNLQASTDNVANFYDANRAFENETTTRHALALLGFSAKDYFDSLGISSKTQFNFWRGLIQLKGTNASIDAYLNNNRFYDAKIDEYWAYKVAEYGDSRQRTFPELKLSVNDALTQFTQLQFDSTTLAAEAFITIDRFDENRWFSIDDMDHDAYFIVEVVGTFTLPTAEVGALYELPFIADKLIGAGFEQVNATTIRATAASVALNGYGPARPRFNPVKLFNYVDNELVAEIPLWHPAAGQHTPVALESINIISNVDPARYNYSTQVVNNSSYDPLRPWGAKEVGRVWLDTRNLSYLPYYDATIFPSLAERLSRWGTLADYATIDVYEWVQSSVPPTEYNALALTQAGNADLDPLTKAAGQAANQETYARDRVWYARPVAWSYSPVPVDVDWGGSPPFPGGSFNSKLFFDNETISLELGSFADFGIAAGMHIGAWDPTEHDPKPLSEYVVEDSFTRVIIETGTPAAGPVPATIEIASTGSSPLSGQLLFSTIPTEVIQRINADETAVPVWDVIASLRVIEVNTGEEEEVVIASEVGTAASGALHGAVSTFEDNQLVIIDLPVLELQLRVTVTEGDTYAADALRDTLVAALADRFWVRNAARVSPVIPNPGEVVSPLSNDPLDPEFTLNNGIGWRAWTVPTQAQLNADGRHPNSAWKPYLGDFQQVTGTLMQVQDAIAYAESPWTLNDGSVVERYRTAWTEWVVLEDVVLTQTQVEPGPLLFTHPENIDAVATSVYVNGISQLKTAFTITGKNLLVTNVLAGSKVTVVIRKYQPTAAELDFDPETADDLAVQRQYKQDYEYVAVPIRDSEGAFTSILYYFWVKSKTTAAVNKKLSVQAIAQELREGPSNFLTFQSFKGNGASVIDPASPEVTGPYRYDAITISGLSYIVTKNDTFKLRFTRNFTLRDDPENLNLKDVHTEWALIRPGQRSKIPETLWQKLTDSVAGMDAAGNVVPAIRRTLYDERHGTRSQFGFDPEQTLAPAELLKSSITYTILNTKLIDESMTVAIPDYITFLDLDESATWFASSAAARKTMTDIWNQAKVEQVNEIFFTALDDILANNYKLENLFKTSRLSAYSIKLVNTISAQQVYE